MFVLKVVKVVCFDADLQVLILRVLPRRLAEAGILRKSAWGGVIRIVSGYTWNYSTRFVTSQGLYQVLMAARVAGDAPQEQRRELGFGQQNRRTTS